MKRCPLIHWSLTHYQTAPLKLYQMLFFCFFWKEDAASGNHLFPFCNPPLHGTFTCPAKAIVKSFFFLLPLRSNISVVQSIVLDRQLLELELGHLVTDNMACLFNFLLCNSVALKWVIINHCGYVHHVSCQRAVQRFCVNVRVCVYVCERTTSNSTEQYVKRKKWKRTNRTGNNLSMCAIYVRMCWHGCFVNVCIHSQCVWVHLWCFISEWLWTCEGVYGCSLYYVCVFVHLCLCEFIYLQPANHTSQVTLGSLERLQCMSFNVTQR